MNFFYSISLKFLSFMFFFHSFLFFFFDLIIHLLSWSLTCAPELTLITVTKFCNTYKIPFFSIFQFQSESFFPLPLLFSFFSSFFFLFSFNLSLALYF